MRSRASRSTEQANCEAAVLRWSPAWAQRFPSALVADRGSTTRDAARRRGTTSPTRRACRPESARAQRAHKHGGARCCDDAGADGHAPPLRPIDRCTGYERRRIGDHRPRQHRRSRQRRRRCRPHAAAGGRVPATVAHGNGARCGGAAWTPKRGGRFLPKEMVPRAPARDGARLGMRSRKWKRCSGCFGRRVVRAGSMRQLRPACARGCARRRPMRAARRRLLDSPLQPELARALPGLEWTLEATCAAAAARLRAVARKGERTLRSAAAGTVPPATDHEAER